MTTTKRTKPDLLICGWCAGSPRNQIGVAKAHRKCHSTDQYPCACATNEHRLTPALADYMARYTQLSIDDVYRAHGRTRRVLSDEQRAQASARLQAARAAKARKTAETTDGP